METDLVVRNLDAALSREDYGKLPKSPLYLVLDNLRSAFNVGAMFRLGDALRLSGILLCGYTAFPPHPKLEKTSRGTVEHVPWEHFPQALDAISHLQTLGVQVAGIETVEGALSLQAFTTKPPPMALVLGNEALGVRKEALKRCDFLVTLPVFGFKNSLNVANAASVCAYSLVQSWRNSGALRMEPIHGAGKEE